MVVALPRHWVELSRFVIRSREAVMKLGWQPRKWLEKKAKWGSRGFMHEAS